MSEQRIQELVARRKKTAEPKAEKPEPTPPKKKQTKKKDSGSSLMEDVKKSG